MSKQEPNISKERISNVIDKTIATTFATRIDLAFQLADGNILLIAENDKNEIARAIGELLALEVRTIIESYPGITQNRKDAEFLKEVLSTDNTMSDELRAEYHKAIIKLMAS